MSIETIHKAYKVRLDLTDAQHEAFTAQANATRAMYNYAIATKRDAHRAYNSTLAELTYTTHGHLDPDIALKLAKKDASKAHKIPGEFDLMKSMRANPDYAWYTNYNTYALASGMKSADKAWKNWIESVSGKRVGARVGYPKFKTKGRSKMSFSIFHDVKKPTLRPLTSKRFQLPKKLSINGSVRLRDDVRLLNRKIARGDAYVSSVTISEAADRYGWTMSILVVEQVTVPDKPTPRQKAGGAVGIDVGIHHLAALSDGTIVDNPRHLREATKKLVKAQRDLSRTTFSLPDGTVTSQPKRGQHITPSNRRLKAKKRLATKHQLVAKRRYRMTHEMTTAWTKNYTAIAIEDLNVAGMTRSAKGTVEAPSRNVAAKSGLNRSILDANFGEIRRQLEYKSQRRNVELKLAPRFAPTSKMCSGCGEVRADLTLKDRVYTCSSCGMVLNRDVNAAKNILAVASA